MSYFLYLFGFLPSIIWLLFYLRKDTHPEPNKMILKIFALGMVSALPAVFLERGFQYIFSWGGIKSFAGFTLIIFASGALIEELLKFLVVKFWVFKSAELDEPVDLILYMIISALGFAALENVLVLTSYHPVLTISRAAGAMGWRFVSATILHALCSALVGYFLVLGFCRLKNMRLSISFGIFLAAALHSSYNLFIIKTAESFGLLNLAAIFLFLSALFFLVLKLFKKAKSLKGVCLNIEEV